MGSPDWGSLPDLKVNPRVDARVAQLQQMVDRASTHPSGPTLDAAEVRRIVREELDAHRRIQALAPQPGELERLIAFFGRKH